MSSKRSKKHQSEAAKVERVKTPIVTDEVIEEVDELVVNDPKTDEKEIVSEVVTERKISTPAADEMKVNPAIFNLLIKSYLGDKNEHGFPHGNGEIEFETDEKYVGYFENGFMEGRGRFKWPTGVVYVGDFKGNEMTGSGNYYWPNGDSYEGQVYRGVRHGRGKFKSANGVPYDGDWKNGKREGRGILKFTEDGKSYYDGEWKDNKRNGQGIRMYRNSDVYDGHWLDNKRHGFGIMKWKDGYQTYKGDWHNDMPHGKGIYEWFVARTINSQYPLRNTYEGCFINGIRQGYGKFIYASGACYEGEWLDDKKHGYGVLTFKNGMVHKGYFENDTISGHPGIVGPHLTTPDMKKINPVGQVLSESDEPSLDIDLTELYQSERMDVTIQEREMTAIRRILSRHISELKTTYKFYSGLGVDESSDNALVLNTMQFTRFLKDTQVHLHGVSLIDCFRFIGMSIEVIDTKSLFLREFFQGIVFIAYLIYADINAENESNTISTRFQVFLERDILPNACIVKGTIFHNEKRTNTVAQYDSVYRGIYKQITRTVRHNSTQNDVPSRRDLLLYLNVIKLFSDGEITVPVVVKLMMIDDDFEDNNECFNFDFKLTFLEFVEILCLCGVAYSAKKFDVHLIEGLGSSCVGSEKEISVSEVHANIEFTEQVKTGYEISEGLCSECNHEERLSPTAISKEDSLSKHLHQKNSKVDNKLGEQVNSKEISQQQRTSRSREKKSEKQDIKNASSDSKRKEKGTTIPNSKKETQQSAVSRRQRKSVSGDAPIIIPPVTTHHQSLSRESVDRGSSVISIVTEEQSMAGEGLEDDSSRVDKKSSANPIPWNGTAINQINDDHWVMCIDDFTKTILIPAYKLQNEINAALMNGL